MNIDAFKLVGILTLICGQTTSEHPRKEFSFPYAEQKSLSKVADIMKSDQLTSELTVKHLRNYATNSLPVHGTDTI